MRALLITLLLAAPAGAADLRAFCPDRPGYDTPACIVDKGHVVVEAGLGAWSRQHDSATVTHSFEAGELLARVGVTDRMEVFGGWTAYGQDRERDRATGMVQRDRGPSDISFGVKQSLLNPGGDGTSIAVLAFATAPTGTGGQGAAGWTQGIIVPVDFELSSGFQLSLSPEIERVPDTVRSGHHARWTGVAGLSHEFGKFTGGIELVGIRDSDPGNRSTQAIADLNLAWQPADNLQFDAEVDAGLSHDAPDVRIAFGVARRF